MEKKCTTCGAVKSYEEFYAANQHGKPGRKAICIPCDKIAGKIYRAKNREKERSRQAEWTKNNREKANARVYRYQKRNPQRASDAASRKYYALKAATPRWLTVGNLVEIKWAYELAKERSLSTGNPHVIDHIIPLQGENICGLHVPWNLQILTRSENSKKGNKVWQT